MLEVTAKELDRAIKLTVDHRAAKEYLRRARNVKRWKLPFSIDGLEDEYWIEYRKEESERKARIETAIQMVKDTGKALRNHEAFLSMFMPYGVWVLHTYKGKQFGIGIAYQKHGPLTKYALRIELIEKESDLHNYPPLYFQAKNLRLVQEWEEARPLVWAGVS